MSCALWNSSAAETSSPSAAHDSPSRSAVRAHSYGMFKRCHAAAAARRCVSASDAAPSPSSAVPTACAAIARSTADDEPAAMSASSSAATRTPSTSPVAAQDVDGRGQQRRSFERAVDLLECAANRCGRRACVPPSELEQRQPRHRRIAVAVRLQVLGFGAVECTSEPMELGLLVIRQAERGMRRVGEALGTPTRSSMIASRQSPEACWSWDRWTRHWPR